MERFTERVLRIIKEIPPGKVMTYGQIAALAGSPRGARQVVRILHAMSKAHQLPWHRVVNAQGKIGLQDEAGQLQKMYLESEGVVIPAGRPIDLGRYQHHPVAGVAGDE